MCPKTPDPVKLGDAPDAPLPAADAPEVGKSRLEENRAKFGKNSPDYRVDRKNTVAPIAPGGPIVM